MLRVDGHTYVHRAGAVGALPETDPARARLAAFTRELGDLGRAPLGWPAYAPDRYLVAARPAATEAPAVGRWPSSPPVGWPVAAGVRLADARTCAAVPAPAVRDLLARASEVTLFRDHGVDYTVSAVPEVPGATCGG